jgi:hypothetical protein
MPMPEMKASCILKKDFFRRQNGPSKFFPKLSLGLDWRADWLRHPRRSTAKGQNTV